MTRTHLAAALSALTVLALAACTRTEAPPPLSTETITYTLDRRTSLCFATIGSRTYAGFLVTSVTEVPCTPAVLNAIGDSQ